MTQHDNSNALQQAVAQASQQRKPLCIQGAGSKKFLGHTEQCNDNAMLDMRTHSGIVSHEPTELVVTVRSGTTVAELEAALKEHGQMLAFEPPQHSNDSTIGGVVACGLSGPRRHVSGSVRDYVLGVRCINGRGELLSFGGQVMKNVAGYDVSRLLTGSMGTLAVMLDISFKLLPAPEVESTRVFELTQQQALQKMLQLSARPLPVTATAYDNGRLYVRVSGMEVAVAAAISELGGEQADNRWWTALRNQTLPLFNKDDSRNLWRLSVPASAPLPDIEGESLIDWGGAQYWLRTDEDAAVMREQANRMGGHATLYFGDDTDIDVFHPLPKPVMRWHRRLKGAFDPHNILNPGRMYRDLEPEQVNADAVA